MTNTRIGLPPMLEDSSVGALCDDYLVALTYNTAVDRGFATLQFSIAGEARHSAGE